MHPPKIGAALLLALFPFCAFAQSPPPAGPPPSAPPAQSEAPPKASPAVKEARKRMRMACAPDAQKFCANIERGNLALQACLRSHRRELSGECTSARAELRATRAKEKG